MMEHENLMQLAIDIAREGIEAGEPPFGYAIAFGGRVFVERNRVKGRVDVTAHAEINALRVASTTLGTRRLEGALVASTSEPCVMCAGALHWAGVDKVCFGTTIEDVKSIGFDELAIPAADLFRWGGSNVGVVPAVLRDQCLELLKEWSEHPTRSWAQRDG
jgi:guanine deaminase